MNEDIIILQDTREKHPWDFTFFGFTQHVETLKTGDYSIFGLEHVVRIERKQSTSEIAMNVGKQSKRFLAEMERMTVFPHRYIICEFPYSRILEFPKNSGIPKNMIPKVRMNGGYIGLQLEKIKQKYGVHILFCQDSTEAQELAVEIFNRVIDEVNTGKIKV